MARLRTRLLFSYIAIILVMLCVVSLALAVLLANNPLSIRIAYSDLRAIAIANARSLRSDPALLDQRLAEIAQDTDTRTIRLDSGGAVAFDSAGSLTPGTVIDLSDFEAEGSLERQGEFSDDTGRWLYFAFYVETLSPNSGIIVFARPRPGAGVAAAFGGSLLGPMVRAGLIGLGVAVILAGLVASSVAKPLRRFSEAARAIAAGDYGQRVEGRGPREVRDLAASFNEMAGQVQRSQQTQRDFLANISHELKTPLTSIQGYSQAILDGAAADPGRAASVIHDEAARMRRMVEQLLDLARIESGQTPLRREYVDLSALLGSVLERLSIQAAEKGITLAHQVAPLPRITGDGDRLAQVFTNLIDNALGHTPSGGRVTVQAGMQGQGVQVDVLDTGEGIPPEDLERIFERFYRVDKSRVRSERKGTGLGLAISREIITQHGGTIRAEAPPEGGALFRVWLPLPRPTDETVSRLARGTRRERS